MDDLQSEKEQIEEMRAWWSEYGRYAIAGVVIAVALLFGFNQYQSSKLEAEIAASELYEELVTHVLDGDLDQAEAVTSALTTDYANTSYAAQSKLAIAKLYMDVNRDQDAADTLRELLEMRGNDELRNVGRLRLARVLLYQDKAQEVVDLLGARDDPGFNALYAETLGDAYAALGLIEQAEAAYLEALADASQTVNRALVQMKLTDLPPASSTVVDTPDDSAAAGAGDADDNADPESGESQ